MALILRRSIVCKSSPSFSPCPLKCFHSNFDNSSCVLVVGRLFQLGEVNAKQNPISRCFEINGANNNRHGFLDYLILLSKYQWLYSRHFGRLSQFLNSFTDCYHHNDKKVHMESLTRESLPKHIWRNLLHND